MFFAELAHIEPVTPDEEAHKVAKMAHKVDEWTKTVAETTNIVSEMAHLVPEIAHRVAELTNRVGVVRTRHGEFMFYRLRPLSHCMKTAQPELVVGLDEKLTRVLTHWKAVDRGLPAAHPLVLLESTTREASQKLATGLPALREVVEEREMDLAVARGNYGALKADMHRVLRLFNSWMRGCFQGTSWFPLVRRVPGRGQSYGHWSGAATNALNLWQRIVKAPPDPEVDPLARPLTLGDGTTVKEFAKLVRAFDVAYGAIGDAEVDLKIARGDLWLAQDEATALLMAYGHGLRARFGDHAELIRSMPVLWPKNSVSSKKKRKRSRTRNRRRPAKAGASAA